MTLVECLTARPTVSLEACFLERLSKDRRAAPRRAAPLFSSPSLFLSAVVLLRFSCCFIPFVGERGNISDRGNSLIPDITEAWSS